MNVLKNQDYKADLEKLGVISFVPKGNSMWPMLKNRGQSVIVEKKQNRLKLFDVGFFVRNNGAFVLHRVVKVLEDGYVFCGDSQLVLETIKEEQVFGIMTAFYQGKKCIDARDEKYVKKVERYYKHTRIRKFRIKCFLFRVRLINKLKRIFKVEDKNV